MKHMNSDVSIFFSDHSGCVVLRQDRRKIILRCSEREEFSYPLFVKIYRANGTRQSILESMTLSAGERSLRTCRKLAALGIDVPEPVGFAEKKNRLGLLSGSLFAAKWISDMESLRDFAVNLFRVGYHDTALIESLNASLGSFVAKLHSRGVQPADLNAGNLLIRRQNDNSFHIMLVDFEDIAFVRSVGRKAATANLAQIAAFMLPISKDAAEQVCYGYSRSFPEYASEAAAREVDSHAQSLFSMWERKLNRRFSIIEETLKEAAE